MLNFTALERIFRTQLGNLVGVAPVLVLLALLLIIPFFTSVIPGDFSWDGITIYDWQRILFYASVGVSVSVSLPFDFRAGKLNIEPWILYFFVLVMLQGVFSAFVNELYFFDALREISNAAVMMCGFLVISNRAAFLSFDCYRQLFLVSISASALLYTVVFFVGNFEKFFFVEWRDVDLYFRSFSNIRFFSDYQAFVAPFLIIFSFLYLKSFVSRVVGWPVVILFLSLAFFSGSRSFFLGQFLAQLSLLVIVGRQYWGLLKWQMLAWIGAFFIFFILTELIPHVLDVGVGVDDGGARNNTVLRKGLSARDILWSLAWKDMIEHPVFGIGPGEFSRHLNPIAASPHNSGLMIASEWGWITLLGCLGFVYVILKRCAITLKGAFTLGAPCDANMYFIVAVWLAFTALLGHALVVNVLGIPTSQLCFLIAASLAYVVSRPISSVKEVTGGGDKITGGVFVMLLTFSTASAIAVMVHDIPGLPERNKSFLQCKRPTSDFCPRFWQQGWLIKECPKE